jgi:hypothetical protein
VARNLEGCNRGGASSIGVGLGSASRGYPASPSRRADLTTRPPRDDVRDSLPADWSPAPKIPHLT